MAIQHAEQYIASLYDYRSSSWSTPESAYARRALEAKTGGRSLPAPGRYACSSKIAKQIRERIEKELAR